MINFEEKIVDERKVFCDGIFANCDSGHPGVYLVIPNNSKNITCPYCSKKFVLKTSAEILSDSQL